MALERRIPRAQWVFLFWGVKGLDHLARGVASRLISAGETQSQPNINERRIP